MKKALVFTLAMVMALVTVIGFTGCKKNNAVYVANAIEGIEVEEYGYCINKEANDHDTTMAAINQVINEADISAIVSYYNDVVLGNTPAVTLEFPDLSDNTAGTIEVYTCSGFEPYEFIDKDGETVIGVDMYIMSLVAEKLNKKMTIHDVAFPTICGTVATNKDAIGAAGITINDERKASVDFSNAYYSSVQYIISKDSEAFTTFAQISGKKIGVQKGTTGSLMVEEAINNGTLAANTEMIEYDTSGVAYTALKAGRCDYVVIDQLPAQKLVAKK